MTINREPNTKKQGVMEFLVYKEGDSYVGVCLTFDIIEEGSNPVDLMKSLKEASELHLETVIKNNLSDDLLNRHAPTEYWVKYFEALQKVASNSINGNNFPMVSPYHQTLIADFA